MTREVINTRVELDREVDTEVRKIARKEARSKRQMMAMFAIRICRLERERPAELRQLGLIRD
jgi:hypothetical protein